MNSGTTTGTEQQRKLVYVVEDDKEQLYVLRILLSDAGFDVVTETDADKALDGVQALRPDIILMDVMLPSHSGIDGFELCANIRKLPDFKDTPIFIVSAITEGATHHRDKMMTQAGANEFITKPYDPPVLIEKIRQYLP